MATRRAAFFTLDITPDGLFLVGAVREDGRVIEQLQQATQRLVRTLDGLSDVQLAEPSLLPGWSRAHVAAHLVLAGEGLTGAVRGVSGGEVVTMYASEEKRDADIAALAAAPSSTIRDRLLAVTTELVDAVRALPDERADTVFERTPGSPVRVVAGTVPAIRLREVEVHHADLDTGYTAHDWAPEFAERLVDQLAGRTPATLVATELARTWQGETGAATVTGAAADLGWWLAGRGDGSGLTSNHGELPGIGAW